MTAMGYFLSGLTKIESGCLPKFMLLVNVGLVGSEISITVKQPDGKEEAVPLLTETSTYFPLRAKPVGFPVPKLNLPSPWGSLEADILNKPI
jgi:hypothetical protein